MACLEPASPVSQLRICSLAGSRSATADKIPRHSGDQLEWQN